MDEPPENPRWTVPVGDHATTVAFDPGASPAHPAVCILAHGAGTHMDHRVTLDEAQTLKAQHLDVLRFNFLYRQRAKGPPDRMNTLRACYGAVIDDTRARFPDRPLILAGRSMGSRVATHLAADATPCLAVLALAYPLHPAKQPERTRADHLPAINVPTLFVSGTRDALFTPDVFAPAPKPPRLTIHWIDGADHSFNVLKRSGRTREDVLIEIGRAVHDWLPT